jgi:hypothetical protein
MRTLIKGNQAILAIISQIQASGKLLDDEIQLAAMSCINHIEEHGDITVACTLYLSMPKGARKAALSAWLMTYGKLEANTGLNKAVQPFTYAKNRSTDLEGGEANPWYGFKKDKAPDAVFNLTESIERLIARVEAAAKKGLTVEGIEAVESLRKLVPQK